MAIFDQSVAGQPAVKKETAMLKSPKEPTKKETATADRPKRVAVIKNGHTAAELAESGERWATHAGPYMTLTEVLSIEAAKQK